MSKSKETDLTGTSGDNQVTDDPTLSVSQEVEEVKSEKVDESDFEAVLDEEEVSEESQEKEIEASKESEPEQEPEKPETDEGPAFDQSFLDAAGLTPEQAAEQFSTPQDLERAVRMLDARFVQAGQQYMGQQQAAQPPAQQPTETPDVTSGLPHFQMPKPSGEDDWDDDTKALVKALDEHYQKSFLGRLSEQDKKLQEQQEALLAVIQEKQHLANQQYVDQFDSFVNGLGDEWSSVLGKGRVHEVSHLYLQNRSHLDSVAAQLQAGRRAYNQPDLPTEEVLKRALPIAFPEVQKQAVTNDVREKVIHRQQLKTNRPTQRRSSPLTGEAKAAERVKDWFESRGMATYDDDFEYEDAI